MDDTPEWLEAYVRSALLVQGYRLDEAHVQRVLEQFARIEHIARRVDSQPLPFGMNAAPVFRP